MKESQSKLDENGLIEKLDIILSKVNSMIKMQDSINAKLDKLPLFSTGEEVSDPIPIVPTDENLEVPPLTQDYLTLEQFGGSPDSPDNWSAFAAAIREQQKNGQYIVLSDNTNYKILGFSILDVPKKVRITGNKSSLTIGIPNYNKWKDSGESDYLLRPGKNPDIKITGVDILAPEQWMGVQLHNRELLRCPADIESGSIIWIGNGVKQNTPSWGLGFIYSGTKDFVKVAQCKINHYGSRFQDMKCNNGATLLSVIRDCTVISNESNNIARWEIEGEFKDGKFYPDNFNLDKLKGYYWNDKDIFYSLQFGTGYLYFFGSDFKEDHVTIPNQLNIGDKTDKGYVTQKWYAGSNKFDYEFSDNPVSINPIPTGKTKLFICFRKNNTTVADGVRGYGHPWLTELSPAEMPNKPFYNHPSMAADWGDLKINAYYRQSVKGEGKSFGFKLENVTGLEGQFDPAICVEEHDNPAIQGFINHVDSLLNR
ncbi:hypothetical protein [Algoriphagus sp. NG3]|uniref:hypothetical protein n=1 Tax=unclassified Algoriphagus TaxID=2641541 RepID=UPI002A80EC09|nr:hypothetical protein [Algoriphagus sp. NG3]WPR74890.1 hypothetical protein SLW71_19685 [Algoriphagus sp. NG3]